MTPIRRLGWTTLALFALVGCEPAAPPPGTAPPKTGGPGAAPSNEVNSMPVEPKKDSADAKPLSEEEIAEIKKLPADEQPVALAQMSCPVSKDHLGEMGMPIKQVIGDKTFYLCCSGCEKRVKSDPDGVLADLAKLKK